MKETTKTKRVKQCFKDKYEVSHIWAQQNQERGWCAGKRVFFEGTDLYSYGHHYLLGRIYTKRDGTKYALINSTHASVTTSTHQGAAEGAVRGLMPFFCVPNPGSLKALENIQHFEEIAVNALMGIFTRNSLYCYDGNPSKEADKDVKGLLKTIEECNEFFKLAGAKQIKLDDDTLSVFRAKSFELLKKGAEKTSVAREKSRLEEVARLNEYNDKLNLWVAGADVQLPYLWHSDVDTKIRVKDDSVETTRGASVPLEHAVRLIRKLVAGSVRKGERVGEYTFEKLNKGIVKIGCHEISLDHAKDVLGKYLNN